MLKEIGEIHEDLHRQKFYKFFCKTEYAELFWKPHRFSYEANIKIPYSKIDINPKYFSCFSSLYDYLNHLLGAEKPIPLSHFHVSRIDLKADIENLPIDIVLSRLHAQGYRRESVTILKGSTIYIGSNPLIRIYDKGKEIKSRGKKGEKLLDWEQEIIDSKKQVTRFEVQV